MKMNKKVNKRNLIVFLVFLFFLFAGSSRSAFAQIINPFGIKRELPPTPPTKPEPPVAPTPPAKPECPDPCGPCSTLTPTPVQTNEPTPTPVLTPTPTSFATPTLSITPTPTPSENNGTDGGTSEVSGTGGTPEVQGLVLGVQTLGATGSFEENFFGLILTAGFIIASMGVRKLGRKSLR